MYFVKWSSPNKETGLENRGPLEALNHARLGPIWHHSEPSNIPYSPNQFLGWDFSCRFLQQDSSSTYVL